MKKYEMTVGIECHVQLNTKTKLFSGVDNDAVDKEPNACVSPVDYALPGMLPVLNREAIKKAVQAGLAMKSSINLVSRFDRKHYFYPDLPKGYQITQMYQPIVGPGVVELPDGSKVRIEHAHLEEDAGKLIHAQDYSLVDLNRAGTPLVEIVTMPDIHSAAGARLFCEELHRLMLYAGVTNGNLYHGNMRFDVNVSVAPEGSEELGTRTEIKNLNSFRSVERVLQYESQRQIDLLEKSEKVMQETRGWSDATGKTTAQRSKENAQDYRYMPEPDVPPVVITDDFVRELAAEMPLTPGDYRQMFSVMNLAEAEVTSILNYPELAQQLAAVLAKGENLAVRVAHWFSGVLMAEENANKDFGLATAAELAELAEMVEKNELSSTAGKEVFVALYDDKNTTKSPRALAKEMNLLQENDEGALIQIVDEVLALPECAKAAADVKRGEAKAIGFLVGQVMKKSGGKANPATVNQLIRQKLN